MIFTGAVAQPLLSAALPADTLSSPRVQPAVLPLGQEAAVLRRDILEGLHASGGGHYGGSLSVIDILTTLYRRQLRVVPSDPRHPRRDRLIMSKGHAAMALYAVLRRLEFFEHSLLEYASMPSPLEGHPDMDTVAGVDFSTGSLGQGLSVAAGMALALRGGDCRVWAVLGDGECQEGQVWEAALVASKLCLHRLHVVVDCNGFQEWVPPEDPYPGTRPSAPSPVPGLASKWSSFGWRVFEADGHDHAALTECYERMNAERVPSVLLAHTVKGKGFPLIEADPGRFHCATLSDVEFRAALGSL